MKKTTIAAALAVALALLSGCASKQTWLSDYDEGQKLAEKDNKKLFLLFSARETDEASGNLMKLFEGKDVQAALKGYVLVNIDFSESRYIEAEAPEDADEAALEAAEKAQELLIRDSEVAQRYSVEGLPMAYLLTKEGYVIAAAMLDPETATAAQFAELLGAQQAQVDTVDALVTRIESTGGIDKALAINELYESTEVQYRFLLSSILGQIPELDPDNTTGFLGKFTLQNAYNTAMDYLNQGDVYSAVAEFVNAAALPVLSAQEKQEALFTAAYFMANTGAGDLETVLDYLVQAYDAAPDSENAPVIVSIMTGLMAEQTEGE
jgi:thioredoxin-related protein